MHLLPPWGNPQGGLFIGVVRGPVTMSERPPNYPIYTEYIVTGKLQSFHTFIYFTRGLLNGDTCPLLSQPPSDDITWAFGTGSPSDKDRGGFIVGLHQRGPSGPSP
jgi:hypothetical protein